MKILYTITSYPPAIGGTQFYTHQIASHLARAGHQVQVVSYWDASRTDWLLGTTLAAHQDRLDYTLDGVPVHRMGLSLQEKLGLVPSVLAYWPLQGPAIRHIARQVKPMLQATGTDWQLIHNVRQGREALTYASWHLARSLGIPFVFTPVHHPRWGGWLHRHYQALYRAADAVIALTHAEKEALVGLGVASERVYVTGTGPVLAPAADGRGFRARLHLGSAPIVLFVGTHYSYKGIELILSAAGKVWEQFPDTRFLFIGAPTRHSRRVFAGHQDARVVELGTVDSQTKTDALAACDLLCVPSTQESFGAVYAESWAMGKPVIAADIPATREVVSDGIDGYLVPVDPLALAGRVCALLAEPALRERMGEIGRQKVHARYTWEKLAGRTEQIYRHVLQAGRVPAGNEEGGT
ncbi:MAG TPA: glycosyltransferase family 4 protein [Anaerolineae bacterium]|nr:glycosyltransferase family 4 protein [Anaerolineae bacterium]